ncbi:MAG: hypothetical protein EOM20_07750 [Spartobacteria bacterium]|nr:hypothetical protein [Spartobacteria bacterium]
MKTYPVITLLAITLLTACGRAPTPKPVATPEEIPIPDIFLAHPPAGQPVPIPLARQQAKPGDTLILEGLIMGTRQPFVEGRAVFLLGDRATLTPCNERPGDTCPTPWDVCCDTLEAKREGVATIQIVDEQGAVLRRGLKGVQGLTELQRLRVIGKVAPQSSPDALIVNAEGFYKMSASDAAPTAKPVACSPTCAGH